MSNSELKAKFARMGSNRLLTLIFKGGMSKRMAIQAAHIVEKRFPTPKR